MLAFAWEDHGVVRVTATGTLTKEDNERLVREFERIGKSQRPLRVLLVLDDFQGWDLDSLWEELSLDTEHADDPGKVAVVGTPGLEEWSNRLTHPFFTADIKFFEHGQNDEARDWLKGRRQAA